MGNRKAAAKVNEAVKAEPEVHSGDIATLEEEISILKVSNAEFKEELERVNGEIESLKQLTAQTAESEDAKSESKNANAKAKK